MNRLKQQMYEKTQEHQIQIESRRQEEEKTRSLLEEECKATAELRKQLGAQK